MVHVAHKLLTLLKYNNNNSLYKKGQAQKGSDLFLFDPQITTFVI